MEQIVKELKPPTIVRERKTENWSGYVGGDWNYCIKYEKLEDCNPKKFGVLKLAGTDSAVVHKMIGEVITETCGFSRVIDIWMEPLSAWYKQGKYKFYEIDKYK